MTAQNVVDRLFHEDFDVTPDRVMKARALAKRSGVEWSAVVARMTPEQRAQVGE